MSTDSVQVQGFVIIRYSDHEVQMKVQSMKHTIKNHEVDVTFQRVCRVVYVIVCNYIKKCNVMQHPHYDNYTIVGHVQLPHSHSPCQIMSLVKCQNFLLD